MAGYVYLVRRNRENSPHLPWGFEELETNDLTLATSIIASHVIQFDIGNMGDDLNVVPLSQGVSQVITDELIAKCHETQPVAQESFEAISSTDYSDKTDWQSNYPRQLHK